MAPVCQQESDVGDEIPKVDRVADDAIRAPRNDPPVGGHDSETSPEEDLRVNREQGTSDLSEIGNLLAK